MPIETLLAFSATALLLAFVPGPDNIFVMTQAAIRGWRAGFIVVLGLCAGLIVHTTAVALGVAVLFQRSQLAFDVLKYAGSAYLVYLAWQSWRAEPAGPASSSIAEGAASRFFLKGVVMNVTNPKVSIFFLAFLPQFVDFRAGNVTAQLFALGGVFILATLLAFGLMSAIAAHAGARIGTSPRAQRIMNKVAGAVFLGLAAKLATTDR